jgi:hypothetical protein
VARAPLEAAARDAHLFDLVNCNVRAARAPLDLEPFNAVKAL